MKEQSIALLKECSSGCKMAIENMNQILEYVQGEALRKVISDFIGKHEQLERKSGEALRDLHEQEKSPGMAAAVMSKLTTDIKMMIKEDDKQAAKILMDGCNMGIQSISEARNQNSEADKQALDLTAKLIRTEEELMKQLRAYL